MRAMDSALSRLPRSGHSRGMPLSYVPPQDPARSALMARVRRSGTAPELTVAKALRALGLSYRKNVTALAGSPDFANRRGKRAVFVHGCFWHHHRCGRGRKPKANLEYWVDKFARNRSRDARSARTLRRAGFRVLIIWECECGDTAALLRELAKRPACDRSKWAREDAEA